jgi:hypothetical protein
MLDLAALGKGRAAARGTAMSKSTTAREAPRLLRLEEVASLCCRSLRWVQERIAAGELATVPLGGRVRVPEPAALAFRDRLRRESR